ncbi:hypothetical protein KKC1_01110 [Calderihabitans maritimus]|uniref:Uncharacterized protein n=1 Tax=Calderihabitans maritimus TaxID=1246530 RepID=A0A1Z5HN52_9FIRM|nr:hypothetical protein KKC1_01110 [Calderihabitans maritimus]
MVVIFPAFTCYLNSIKKAYQRGVNLSDEILCFFTVKTKNG